MSVYKVTYTKGGKRCKTDNFYVEFKDHLEIVRRLPAYASKGDSLKLQANVKDLVTARELGRAPDVNLTSWIESMPAAMRDRLAGWGLLDSKSVAATKTLAEHLADFQAGVLANGASAEQALLVRRRAERALTAAGCVYWSDVTPNGVIRAISDFIAAENRSHQTFNFYLAAVKQFANWLVDERRIADNPLGHLKGRNVKEDRRHDRRALTADECRALLQTTEAQPPRWGMSGHERALLYWLALETGLRAGELRSLTRAGFSLGRKVPSVTVEAAYSKNGKRSELYLRADLAAAMRDHLADKLPAAPAFNLEGVRFTAKMLRDDLAAARIPYCDESGRFADFHALRHTFISNLANGGVMPAVAQQLARHSSITLTMDRYTHVALGSQTAALERLPSLDLAPAQAEAATGTDGAILRSSLRESLRSPAALGKTPVYLDAPRGRLDGREAALQATSAASKLVAGTGLEPVT